MNDEMKPKAKRPTAAFVLSLIAAIWMLLSSGMIGLGHMGGYAGGGYMMEGDHHGGGYGMIWRHHQMMYGYGGGMLWGWTGVIVGLFVLIGAVLLYTRPSTSRVWGVVILVASVGALLAGAGGFLAGILGAIGGILAITWKAETS